MDIGCQQYQEEAMEQTFGDHDSKDRAGKCQRLIRLAAFKITNHFVDGDLADSFLATTVDETQRNPMASQAQEWYSRLWLKGSVLGCAGYTYYIQSCNEVFCCQGFQQRHILPTTDIDDSQT